MRNENSACRWKLCEGLLTHAGRGCIESVVLAGSSFEVACIDEERMKNMQELCSPTKRSAEQLETGALLSASTI